jgi:hypothetical protein
MLELSCRRCRYLAAALLCALAWADSARSQPASAPPNSVVNLNYVYAASLGFGGYSLSGLSANVYTLPLTFTLPSAPVNGWTVKVLLPVQLGLYELRGSFQGQQVDIHQQSLAAAPGVELQIPLNDRLVVKPFVQGGIVHSFGAGAANPDSWLYLAGARSVAQWHYGETTLSLGNGLVFAGDATIGSGFSERYVALQVAGEVRHPIGFKIGNWTPDVGVYVADYFYPSALRFDRFLNTPLEIRNQNEIGFSVGNAEPFTLLGLSNPRIGAGFVFGGGLNVYRVSFGFPF